MSEAVVQFMEIVNQAPQYQRLCYCPQCGQETPHTIHVQGNREYFTCQNTRNGNKCCNVTVYTTK